MTGWIIAGIVILLLIALLLIRVGIRVLYSEVGLEVWAKLAFFELQVFPRKKGQPSKRESKEMRKGPDTEEEHKEKGGPIAKVKQYFDPALALLKSLKRSIRIDLLKVRFVAAAKDDAAKAAILYGQAWAAEGIILAVLENNITVRKKEIAIEVDYQMDQPTIYCRVQLSVTIGGLLLAGFQGAKVLFVNQMKEKGGAKYGKTDR